MRTTAMAAVAAFALSVAGCGEAVAPESTTVRLSLEPTDSLRQLVEENPSEFTWDAFGQGVLLRATGGVPRDGTTGVELCALSIDGTADAIRKFCSGEVEVDASRLAAGVTTGELLEGTRNVLGDMGRESSPLHNHDLGRFLTTPQFVGADEQRVASAVAARSEAPDPEKWYAVVVYANSSAPSPGRDRVRPLALVVDPHYY